MPTPKALKTETVVPPLGYRIWLGVPHVMQAAHRHGDVEINYFFSGKVTYLFGGSLVEIPARRLAIFWAAVPHELLKVEHAQRGAWATLPLAWLLDFQLPQSFLRPLLEGALLLDPKPEARDEEHWRRWESDFLHAGPQGPARREVVALELEARLKRMAFEAPLKAGVPRAKRKVFTKTNARAPQVSGKDGAKEGRGEMERIEAMAQYIAQAFAEPLRVEEIAARAGLHPNYATTLFKRRCGMSLMSYLTLQRVAHAQHLLLTTDKGVLQVSLDSGFGSMSRFYEAFKQVCGRSPKKYRAELRKKIT